ncbi:MAG: hypothetical protein Q8K78_18255 [Planctomycetaceae bacterium]|nr:hypothetical protein [Planctomycetaceae bacterium]
MVKRFALLIASAALVSSSVGCCLTGGCGYRGACPPCGAGYSGAGYAPASVSPCGPGGCQPGYGSQSFYQGASAAFVGDQTMMTASPIIPGATYPTTASFPIQSVPVY